jgi:hypothetical protein
MQMWSVLMTLALIREKQDSKQADSKEAEAVLIHMSVTAMRMLQPTSQAGTTCNASRTQVISIARSEWRLPSCTEADCLPYQLAM